MPSLPFPPAPSSDPATPHSMRIATQGHLRTYVAFALKFLQENPPRPLELHTLPLAGTTSEKTIRSTTTTIPMLISTTEVIKREYLALLTQAREDEALARRKAKGKGRATVGDEAEEDVEMDEEMAAGNGDEPAEAGGETGEAAQNRWSDRGFFQYNESGCLEDLPGWGAVAEGAVRDPQEEAERELERLKGVLGGKVGLKMHHTPYLKITLSTTPLPDLAARPRVTTQHISIPLRPSRTKSQAHRRRKRLAKEALAAAAAAVEPESAPIPAPAPAGLSVPKTAKTARTDGRKEQHAMGKKRVASDVGAEGGKQQQQQKKKKQKICGGGGGAGKAMA